MLEHLFPRRMRSLRSSDILCMGALIKAAMSVHAGGAHRVRLVRSHTSQLKQRHEHKMQTLLLAVQQRCATEGAFPAVCST